jgi:protein-disulfide isomerase
MTITRLHRVLVVAMTVLWTTAAGPTLAQDVGSSDRRLEAVEKSVAATQAEIRELSTFLRGSISSPIEEIDPIQLDVKTAQVKGAADASVVLVEFSDFECPFCGQHFRTTYSQLVQKLVETGKLQYVFKNLPLQAIHPKASDAAEAAQCAANQQQFWQMHDRLFGNQQALARGDLRNHAASLGLNMPDYDACIARGDMAIRVRNDLAEATKLGLTGTPTFFLGRRIGDQVRFTRKITGAQQFNVFRAAIQSLDNE